MRWLALLLIAGCVSDPVLLGSNWERICYEYPYKSITNQTRTWLRYEGIVEQRGWIITPEWLNANCETVPGSHLSK